MKTIKYFSFCIFYGMFYAKSYKQIGIRICNSPFLIIINSVVCCTTPVQESGYATPVQESGYATPVQESEGARDWMGLFLLYDYT